MNGNGLNFPIFQINFSALLKQVLKLDNRNNMPSACKYTQVN